MKGQHPRIMQAGFSQFRESGQHFQLTLDFAEKVIRCDEGAFADIPFDSGVCIGLCLAAKADGVLFWRH